MNTNYNTSVNSDGVLRNVFGKSSTKTNLVLLLSSSDVKFAAFKMKSRNFVDCFSLNS